MLFGLSLSIWSLYGLVGVSGVVVNDSLLMIKFINDLRASGVPTRDAIITGSKDRFRPILLTSVTTFMGVAPLIFESSTHAQQFVPLATAVGFGVLIATALLMLVVPALLAVWSAVSRIWSARRAGPRPGLLPHAAGRPHPGGRGPEVRCALRRLSAGSQTQSESTLALPSDCPKK